MASHIKLVLCQVHEYIGQTQFINNRVIQSFIVMHCSMNCSTLFDQLKKNTKVYMDRCTIFLERELVNSCVWEPTTYPCCVLFHKPAKQHLASLLQKAGRRVYPYVSKSCQTPGSVQPTQWLFEVHLIAQTWSLFWWPLAKTLLRMVCPS